MAWLSPFLLGRPGAEIQLDLPPEAIEVQEMPIASVQKNLAGDLKKSVIKASAPTIRINSRRLSPTQRNQLASLAGIRDTFLSFQTRDDWQVFQELVTVIDATHVQIANTSATRLSALLVALGGSSIITVQPVFGLAFGGGAYGAGAYGAAFSGGDFDPGDVSYDDATRIITIENPIDDLESAIFVSYNYKGWLVNMRQMNAKSGGSFADIFSYDIELNGA